MDFITDNQSRNPQIYSKVFVYMQELLDEDLSPQECTERSTKFNDEENAVDLPLLQNVDLFELKKDYRD